MSVLREELSIEYWLVDVREYVRSKAPDLTDILGVYEEEARFGHRYVAADLAGLVKGAAVLEVGAGSLLLSCQLVREGFKVTALEPIGEGFSHFSQLRALILERAHGLGCIPELLDLPAENMSLTECFDYAFSINVMEHVNNVAAVIARITNSLRPRAIYRFTCCNYLFPYEPHFDIPTLFSKRLTERVFRVKIYEQSGLADAVGLWNSLNWITVPQVRHIVSEHPELTAEFNRQFLVSTLERVGSDERFAQRRSRWVRTLIIVLVKLHIHRLAGFIPAALQPVIDCKLGKIGNTG